MSATHDLTNQVPPLPEFNAWQGDEILRVHACAFGARHPRFIGSADELGAFVGSTAARTLAESAHRNPPGLITHDRWGERVDRVDFHPAYHTLMATACRHGLKDWSWTEARAEAPIERAVLFHLWNSLEQGTACPLTMSCAAVAMLGQDAALSASLMPKVCARGYEADLAPLAAKQALTVGMALTEKQGGSDLRAISTRAVAAPEAGPWSARLTGRKWFCSAPMSDGFFTLARDEAGVSCFFVPRMLDDGTLNAMRIVRLKDKCGNRSNASAEIEYEGAWARPIGEPGRGIATLIGMAHLTRFDIVCAVPGMMRCGFDLAWHHAAYRSAFGRRLGEHALMRNVLADLALDWEAALLLALELASAFAAGGVYTRQPRGESAAPPDPQRRALARILTPIAKYWLCKRLPAYLAECMECLGGNGYVEDWPMARLYREAPLNGIWEGSANVICLDVLRSARRDPEAVQALLALIASGQDARLDDIADTLGPALVDPDVAESAARHLVELAAIAVLAALMRRHVPSDIADAYQQARLAAAGTWAYGTLASDAPIGRILERAGR